MPQTQLPHFPHSAATQPTTQPASQPSVQPSTVLVTGGCGYIGSHTCVALAAAGYRLVVLDNLCNSRASVLPRLETLTGQRPVFYQGDVRDAALLARVFAEQQVQAVMHFAGLKAVGDSVRRPLDYYDSNVQGSLVLLRAMQQAGVRRFVFSSSATVYGDPAYVPLDEAAPFNVANPYGRTKRVVEEILADLAASEPGWRIARLRYFNPVGAHESGLIGEDGNDVPGNLMPYICQVAVGRRPCLQVFGDDYPTPDGTGVRDYIHVMDLADGHVQALQHLAQESGVLTLNLGTGQGYSVLDVLRAFEVASGLSIPYQVVARRPGDVAAYWATPRLAEQVLGWRAGRSLAQMCADAWRWQMQNPQGYPEE